MKFTKYIFPLLLIPLVGCVDRTECHIAGTLYTDSTLTEVVAYDSLQFRQGGIYIGTAHTDNMGEWHIIYQHAAIGSGYAVHASKLYEIIPYITITYHNDTLFHKERYSYTIDSLKLFVGDTSWRHYTYY